MMLLGLSLGFRPLSGKWGYRFTPLITLPPLKVLASFRPLSGKWGYRSERTHGSERRGTGQVSVPSRGNGVIDLVEEAGKNKGGYATFPSPLGEMGLSMGNGTSKGTVSIGMFPSPLGEMGLSINGVDAPCTNTTLVSFRPLSGKWGYRFENIVAINPDIKKVSVPSRGNGVIDSIDNASST